MPANTFGEIFRLTTFGESHGPSIGGIIDGMPAGIEIDLSFIQGQLDRRKPGQSDITSPRKESDIVEILSGVFEGKSTGTPIGFIIKNKDQQSGDYDHLKEVYRPGHADFTYEAKYGTRDHRGSGRASARETACRVLGGAFAQLLLKKVNVSITGFVSAVHEIQIPNDFELNKSLIEQSLVRCPDPSTSEKMIALIQQMKEEGDSVGGVVTCICENVPAGWGEPVFDKLNAKLAQAMLSINAVKGFEVGDGFAATVKKGSEHNDALVNGEYTNHDGGIQGGISNGRPIVFNVGFKPVSTISKPQQTLNKSGEEITLEAKGRHDPCVVPRAVPIVEAMAALVLADAMLLQQSKKI
jgi:chorismate synthase